MREVNLISTPNQAFDFQMEAVTFNIALHTITNTLLLCSISAINATDGGTRVLFAGYPVVAGQPLIPFKSMQQYDGNFYFITPNDEIPNWEQFGLSHRLFYLNDDEVSELDAIRNSKTS